MAIQGNRRSYQRGFEVSPASRGITRRKFLTRMGLGTLLLSGAGVLASAAYFIIPKLNYEPLPVFSVGRPEDYQMGDMKLLQAHATFIFLTSHGFQAVSDICTHLGCAYRPYGPPSSLYPEVHARCPCHGSVYARDGHVLHGPAPRPIPFYNISLTADGRMQVNKSIVNLTERLSQQSGEGIGHNLYFDPSAGKMNEGPYPDGSQCKPCQA